MEKKNRIKKSTAITVALVIYVTGVAIYMIPRNTGVSNLEKYVTLIASYAIVFVLWLVLRMKERRQERQKEENEE